MKITGYAYYYFIGIGGIGMSALARYFNATGKSVAGYDKNESSLTLALVQEGIQVHYRDDINEIPGNIQSNPKNTLVVYTPAVPSEHAELNWFRDSGFTIMKRAQVLGELFRQARGIGVAGTHGKTTTSTMIAHLFKQEGKNISAFLGGISKNYQTNLLLGSDPEFIIAEADEYDRSFLNLWPELSVITAMDADHLDIYGTKEEVHKSFSEYAKQIKANGILLMKKGLNLLYPLAEGVKVFSYSAYEAADYYPSRIESLSWGHRFYLQSPQGELGPFELPLPGMANVENAVAALGIALQCGLSPETLQKSLASFSGVKRRFDMHINMGGITYVDDYGHHPEELSAFIQAMRSMFPHRKLTGIFQPHLYTRTRDFAAEFAASLSQLDELVLLDIYPARELPIPGVTSEIIFRDVHCSRKWLIRKDELGDLLEKLEMDVIATMGAGDIENFIPVVKNAIHKKIHG